MKLVVGDLVVGHFSWGYASQRDASEAGVVYLQLDRDHDDRDHT